MKKRYLVSHVPGSPRLWLMLFAACLLAYVFFEIVDEVFYDSLAGNGESHELDERIRQFFMQFRSATLTQVAIDLTALGSVSVLSVFAILAYAAILARRDFVGLQHISVALIGAVVMPLLLKPYFGRDRPPLMERLVLVNDFSFPSGHTFGAAAAYATFAFFCSRLIRSSAVRIFCYLFAFAIVSVVGITRIYLGVHYPTDVLAGLTAGSAWAFLVAACFSYKQSM